MPRRARGDCARRALLAVADHGRIGILRMKAPLRAAAEAHVLGVAHANKLTRLVQFAQACHAGGQNEKPGSGNPENRQEKTAGRRPLEAPPLDLDTAPGQTGSAAPAGALE